MTLTKVTSIACIGECMLELRMGEESTAQTSIAGDVLNTAIYMRRSAPPTLERVSFAGAIGQDSLSARVEPLLTEEEVRADLLLRHPSRTLGLYAISTDADGERQFQYWRNMSAAREMFNSHFGLDFDAFMDFDAIYLSGITLAILPAEARARLLDWLHQYRQKGGMVAFDSNYRPALWEDLDTARDWTSRAWDLCDIGLPSIDDEQDLFGDVSYADLKDRFRSYRIPVCVVKRGRDGPIDLGGELVGCVFPVEDHMVDTTAAGDSFNGSFLANYLTSGDVRQAAVRAHATAMNVVKYNGAIVPRNHLSASLKGSQQQCS